MSKTVLVLGVACIALAAFDVKLLLDLRQHRAGSAPTADLPGGRAAARADGGAATARPGLASLRDSRGARGTRGKRGERPSDEELQRAADADFLRMYPDPRLRQQLVAEFALNERNGLLGVEVLLDIPTDRWDMLSERLAELQVESIWRRMRCIADHTCASDFIDMDLFKQRERVTQEVLGAVKADELGEYRRTLRDRRGVDVLQARLGNSRLPRERAEELIGALHAEGMRLSNEWMAKDSPNMRMHFMGYPRLGVAAYPSSARTSEQQMAAAMEYSQRMRERAAPLLNPEQRAAFEAMQDDILERFEREQRRRSEGS
jgi:hypothetical protein